MSCKYKLLLLLITLLILVAPTSAQTQTTSTYVILLDNTGSMKTQFGEAQALAKAVVKRLHAKGRISILVFETQGGFATVSPGIELEQDESKLTNYIDGLSTVTGQTAFFDAVAVAADRLLDQTKAFGVTEKILILITDGDDRMRHAKGFNNAGTDEDDAWRKARDKLTTKLNQSGITTYAIGLVRELENDGISRLTPRQKAESVLTKITKQTGGRVVISTSKKIDVDKVVADLLGP